MGINNRTHLQPGEFTQAWTDGQLQPPADSGGMYETADGKIYRLVQLHDPNAVAYTQYDAMGYEQNDTTGTKVTHDISESDAGAFAGSAQCSVDPGDDGYFFIQTRGYGSINVVLTSDTVLNFGDAFLWDEDAHVDRTTSASNDVAGKFAGTDLTGLGATEAARPAYLLGVV